MDALLNFFCDNICCDNKDEAESDDLSISSTDAVCHGSIPPRRDKHGRSIHSCNAKIASLPPRRRKCRRSIEGFYKAKLESLQRQVKVLQDKSNWLKSAFLCWGDKSDPSKQKFIADIEIFIGDLEHLEKRMKITHSKCFSIGKLSRQRFPTSHPRLYSVPTRTSPVTQEIGSGAKKNSSSCSNTIQEETQESVTIEIEKAWNFVTDVIHLHEKIRGREPQASSGANCWNSLTVVVDNMIYLVAKMLQCQANFRLEGKDVHIDVGYHYTPWENSRKIREHGLLSRSEQAQMGVSAHRFHGAAHGDGIYTGSNPFAYSSYGRNGFGLLVMRLKGQTSLSHSSNADTTIVRPNDDYKEMVILRNASQCVPVFLYPQELVLPAATTPDETEATMNSCASPFGMRNLDEQAVWHYHIELQKLVDRYFNDSAPTKVNIIQRELANLKSQSLPEWVCHAVFAYQVEVSMLKVRLRSLQELKNLKLATFEYYMLTYLPYCCSFGGCPCLV